MPIIKHVSTFARAALAALTIVAFAAPMAEARPGGGLSVGSRGYKTYTPPPSTRTAPGTAQPMQRSAQPAPQAAAKPAAGAPAVAAPSRFGTGFMGGLLGAGLIGGLLGAGFFGGLGSLMGILGFVLQVALRGGLVYLGLAWWRSRSQPVAAGGRDGYQRTSMNPEPRAGVAAGATAPAPAAVAASGQTKPLTIDGADYAAFERLLSVVQLSFGREDKGALRSAMTPEMVEYFSEQLDDIAAKGQINEIGAPKLLSGDLAEAWADPTGEYATVAMKYAMTDAMVDRASGRVVGGSRTDVQEITEVWTFTRRHGGGPNAWRLSAIQQVS